MSTLKVLPELIKTSILKETHPDKGKDVNIKEIQRLYGTVNYGEKKYPIKITVKIIKSEGNKAYSYEVMGIESPDEQLSHPGNSPTGDIGNLTPKLTDVFPQSAGFSVNKDTNNFETTEENRKKSVII